MRTINPLNLDWDQAVLMQETAPVRARAAQAGEIMPNKERTKDGQMVVLGQDGAALYCMDADDFNAHFKKTGQSGTYEPRPVPRRVVFMDQPGYLPAPTSWGDRDGWEIKQEFTVRVNGKDIKGYPVIEHGPGLFMYEDLNKGAWKPVVA